VESEFQRHKTGESELPAIGSPHRNMNGLVGVSLSLVGLAGWFVTFAVMLSFSYDELSGDGQRDLLIQFGNLLTYLARLFTGFAGLLINGFFSATGCIVSLIGLTYQPRKSAQAGLAAGMLGLGIAAALIVWRMAAWGVL
jgi:hypothetical protein